MEATLKNKLKRGELLVGTIISMPSPDLAEIYAKAGFDWLFVDLEHSVLSPRDAQMILQVASPHTPCLVRVPYHDEVWISKALDIGSAGIIIPQIKTADEARKAVQLAKFPPAGSRGVGVGRAHGYGETFQEYVSSANDETTVIVQIEHIDAVNHLEDILAVDGIDGLLIGPFDLSASMGKTGQLSDPEVQGAMRRVRDHAAQAKMPLGIFCATKEAAKPYIQDGYTLVAVGIDVMMISQMAKNITCSLKKTSASG